MQNQEGVRLQVAARAERAHLGGLDSSRLLPICSHRMGSVLSKFLAIDQLMGRGATSAFAHALVEPADHGPQPGMPGARGDGPLRANSGLSSP
jgi:hypothetical protein